MSSAVQIRCLQGIEPEILTEAFNQAFADYVVPFQANREFLEFRWKLARVDWSVSLGAFDGDELVGFCWHGLDETDGEAVAYNAGTGVLPAYRGRRIVDSICEEAWPLLKERDISRCTLEVIAGNDRAFRVYERIGFQAERELVYMKGELDREGLSRRAAKIELQELADPPWDDLQAMESVQPSWDFMINGSRSQRESVRVVGAFVEEALVGAVILRDSDHTLCWLSISEGQRGRGIGSSLLRHASESSLEWRMVNVDRRAEGLLCCLGSAGMAEEMFQYEMGISL